MSKHKGPRVRCPGSPEETPPILQIENPRRRIVAAAIDAALRVIAVPWGLVSGIPKPSPNLKPRRILCIRLDHIGDFVMTLPAMAAVRAAWPEAHICALVGSWSAPLAHLAPVIDEVIALDCPWWTAVRSGGRSRRGEQARAVREVVHLLRRRELDLAIDFRGDLRHILHFLWRTHARTRLSYTRSGGRALLTHSAPFDPEAHVVDQAIALLASIGIEQPIPSGPHLTEAPESAERVQRWLRASLGGDPPFALIQPGARVALRAWPIPKWVELIDHLAERHALRTVLVGDAGDKDRSDAIVMASRTEPVNLVAQTTVADLVSLSRRATLFVGNDSGVMHLACACGTPAVGLFGPNHPRRCGPRGVPHRVARREFSCSPCLQIRCPFTTLPEGQCMQDLGVPEVAEAVKSLLMEIGAA